MKEHLYNNYNEAIIAQCTPQGSGAIALLRLSGENAFSIADAISKLPNNKIVSSQPTHTIQYGWIVDHNNVTIDQVLFLIMRAPHTFTGDDTIEITCHNNPFIIQNILNSALNAGARLAHNGEFSRRAVINNKIDIIQAEAINDLIHANTQYALKQSLAQCKGSLSQWLTSIEKQLITALALSEASFEFIDEENMEFNVQIKEIIDTILTTINDLKKTFNQQQQLRQGIRVALIGTVNAGKSSLFNALLNKERAIVTTIAGTTRDAIEAGLYKNGNYWTLIDTAGLRITDDIIEQIGIQRSHEEAQTADIILLVFDGSLSIGTEERAVYQQLLDTYKHKIIIIQNKTDIPQQPNPLLAGKKIIFSSSKTKTNIDAIETAIEKKITDLFKTIESPFLLNQRHHTALLSLEQKLTMLLPMLTDTVAYELVSYHLQDAVATFAEFTGKTISEAGMDAVFREFCVGK
jgi:tRNA modification GTPase